MADFQRAIGVILTHEGGWANDPDDPGGATNYGVSLRWVQDHLKDFGDPLDFDFNHDGIIDANDIKAMTVDEAKAIYERDFWNPFPFKDIQDQTVATKFFDMSVNMGFKQASLLVQRALNKHVIVVEVDGAVGPKSIAAVNNSPPVTLVNDIVEQQCWFYEALAQQKPRLAKFLTGWLWRAKWPNR